jgi:V8-like Glu-specific endopeptidase
VSDRALETALDALDDVAEATDYSVVGPRDSRVHEIHTTRFPFNTVCHLGRDFGDGLWRGCSGALIAPRLVLTAGHCLLNHRLGRAPARVRVAPGRRDRDTMPYGAIVSSRYFVPAPYRAATGARAGDRPEHDYGLVVLPRPFPRITRFMPVRALPTAELERLRHRRLITIAGYPADRPVGTMWRHTERLKRIAPRRLFYSVDTCPGHSGSPVWYQGPAGPRIIGVHTSGILDEQGRSYGCAPGTVLAPPGMMNGGIRITQAVLNSIREAGRAGAGGRTRRPPP